MHVGHNYVRNMLYSPAHRECLYQLFGSKMPHLTLIDVFECYIIKETVMHSICRLAQLFALLLGFRPVYVLLQVKWQIIVWSAGSSATVKKMILIKSSRGVIFVQYIL